MEFLFTKIRILFFLIFLFNDYTAAGVYFIF